MIDEDVFAGILVHLAAIMGLTIGQQGVAALCGEVIASRLVKDPLVYGNLRGLAFGQQVYPSIRTIGHHIKSFLGLVDRDLTFYLDQTWRIAQLVDQMVKKVLPYPFFRGQQDEFFPNNVEDQFALFAIFDPEPKRRKIQIVHAAK